MDSWFQLWLCGYGVRSTGVRRPSRAIVQHKRIFCRFETNLSGGNVGPGLVAYLDRGKLFFFFLLPSAERVAGRRSASRNDSALDVDPIDGAAVSRARRAIGGSQSSSCGDWPQAQDDEHRCNQ